MGATPAGPGAATPGAATPGQAAPAIKPIPPGKTPGAAAQDAFAGLKMADGALGSEAGQPGALDWMRGEPQGGDPKPGADQGGPQEVPEGETGAEPDQTPTEEPSEPGYKDGPIQVLGKTFKNRAHLEQAINSLWGLARRGGEETAVQKLLIRIDAMEKALQGDQRPGADKTPPAAKPIQADPSLPFYQTMDWGLFEKLEREGGRGYALSYLLDHVGAMTDARYGAQIKTLTDKLAEQAKLLEMLTEGGIVDLTEQHRTQAQIVSFAQRLESLATAKTPDGKYLYPELNDGANVAPAEFWREFSDRIIQLDIPADQALTPRMFRAVYRDLLSDLASGAVKVAWSPTGPKPPATPQDREADLAGSGGADVDLTPARAATAVPGRTRPRSPEADAISRILGDHSTKRDKDFGISI